MHVYIFKIGYSRTMEHIALKFFTIIMKTSLHVENFCASLKIQRIEKSILGIFFEDQRILMILETY